MTIEDIYSYYLGQEIDGREITEDVLNKAINTYCGNKRGKEVSSVNTNEYIIEMELNDIEELRKQIKSAFNLNPRQPDTSVKFEDIRDMDLGLDLLTGYKLKEKKFIKQRLSELSTDFELSTAADKFLAWRVALCELKIMQLETLLAVNRKEAEKNDTQGQIDLLDKQYKMFCESLNVLKRQRDVAKKPIDDGTNDFFNAIKSVDEMQEEIELEKQEINVQKTKKLKRSK